MAKQDAEAAAFILGVHAVDIGVVGDDRRGIGDQQSHAVRRAFCRASSMAPIM